jgi:hypothetical protein
MHDTDLGISLLKLVLPFGDDSMTRLSAAIASALLLCGFPTRGLLTVAHTTLGDMFGVQSLQSVSVAQPLSGDEALSTTFGFNFSQ